MTVNMCSISDWAHWKFYLLLTDGRTLPTITQHMAKICPFLESKAGIFSSYLPVSDINLAMGEQKRKKTKKTSIWCSICFLSLRTQFYSLLIDNDNSG